MDIYGITKTINRFMLHVHIEEGCLPQPFHTCAIHTLDLSTRFKTFQTKLQPCDHFHQHFDRLVIISNL